MTEQKQAQRLILSMVPRLKTVNLLIFLNKILNHEWNQVKQLSQIDRGESIMRISQGTHRPASLCTPKGHRQSSHSKETMCAFQKVIPLKRSSPECI